MSPGRWLMTEKARGSEFTGNNPPVVPTWKPPMNPDHLVTHEQAAAILKTVNRSRPEGPPLDDFREQLEAVVEIVWAVDRVTKHWDLADKALPQLHRAARKAESVLLDIQASSNRAEVAGFEDLLHLKDVQNTLAATKHLERALSLLPSALLSGKDKRTRGRRPRHWYRLFVENLSDLAVGIGISATTDGDRVAGKETLFTMFVFEVEKLLPARTQSNSLAACAKQIERVREAPRGARHTAARSRPTAKPAPTK